MTTQFRSLNGVWHVATDEALISGQRVNVTRRNGASSNVIINELVAVQTGQPLPRVYSFTDARAAAAPTPTVQTRTIPGAQAVALFELFNRAYSRTSGSAARRPAVRFRLGTTQRGVRFEMAGPSSRYDGSLLALADSAGRNGRRSLYGHMTINGVFSGRVGATQVELDIFNEVATVLSAFAADPAGYSGAHGRMTGHCCYCGRGLTDERSLAVGYGPQCAEHYGLPWGGSVDAVQARRQVPEIDLSDMQTGLAEDGSDVPSLEDIQNEPNAMRRMAMAAQRTSAGLPTVQRDGMGNIITTTVRRNRPQGEPVTTAATRQTMLESLQVRAAARRRAREAAALRETDETQTTVRRAARREPNAPLEEEDFHWPPRTS